MLEIYGVGGELKTYSVHYQRNVIVAGAATLRMYMQSTGGYPPELTTRLLALS